MLVATSLSDLPLLQMRERHGIEAERALCEALDPRVPSSGSHFITVITRQNHDYIRS